MGATKDGIIFMVKIDESFLMVKNDASYLTMNMAKNEVNIFLLDTE